MTAVPSGGIEGADPHDGGATMAKSPGERRPPRPRRGAAAVQPPPRVAADAAEIRRILGPLDDGQVCRILEFGADCGELQQAAAALAGDRPAHIGRPIEGPAARIYDMLAAETFEEPEARAPRGGAQP
jgi:hypothetical protein